jgi:hypothetical protein
MQWGVLIRMVERRITYSPQDKEYIVYLNGNEIGRTPTIDNIEIIYANTSQVPATSTTKTRT